MAPSDWQPFAMWITATVAPNQRWAALTQKSGGYNAVTFKRGRRPRPPPAQGAAHRSCAISRPVSALPGHPLDAAGLLEGCQGRVQARRLDAHARQDGQQRGIRAAAR